MFFISLRCPISHIVPNVYHKNILWLPGGLEREVKKSRILSMCSLTFDFVFVAAEQTEKQHD